MSINPRGAIFAVVVFLASGIAIAVRALRSEGRNRLVLFLTAGLSVASGILIVIFYIYDELVLFPR